VCFPLSYCMISDPGKMKACVYRRFLFSEVRDLTLSYNAEAVHLKTEDLNLCMDIKIV